MTDLERRSSASFISSKEGGTPASFNRSLMKRSSSYCLRVSISTNPRLMEAVRFATDRKFRSDAQPLETNHERTLYVPYVFCNHLISRQRERILCGDAGPGMLTPAAARWCRARRLLRREQKVNAPPTPVPQRDLQAANCPGCRPVWRP